MVFKTNSYTFLHERARTHKNITTKNQKPQTHKNRKLSTQNLHMSFFFLIFAADLEFDKNSKKKITNT